MRQSIFSQVISGVLWALLIVQAGCDVPSSSPAKHWDSPETEEDSLIPPLFTKTKMPGVSIAELQKRAGSIVERKWVCCEAPIIGAAFKGTVVDFSDLCNQFK